MNLGIAVVVLHMITWDADTGIKLSERYAVFPHAEVTGGLFQFDTMENCRKFGVEKAKEQTMLFRHTYPNAFTNVDCQWERMPGEPA